VNQTLEKREEHLMSSEGNQREELLKGRKTGGELVTSYTPHLLDSGPSWQKRFKSRRRIHMGKKSEEKLLITSEVQFDSQSRTKIVKDSRGRKQS